MGWRVAVVCLVVSVVPAAAHAQSAPTPHYVTERELAARRAVHDAAVGATALFVSSTTLATLAWITATLGLFIGASGPACPPTASSCSPDLGDEALLWTGVAAGGLSIVLLIVGAVVDTNRHRLAHALSRVAQARLAPGPGDVGLAFALGIE